MPEEETMDTASTTAEGTAPEDGLVEEVSNEALLARIAAVEANQTKLATELTRAVGRTQSLAARFDKTGDPKVETQLRGEMANLAELIGSVTDSLPPEVLAPEARQRANAAREAARKAAQDADIERRIAERVPAPQVDQDWVAYANQVEELVIADIRSKGLDDSDPAFNWGQMSAMLRAGNVDGLWQYVQSAEASLQGTARRPAGRTAPETTEDEETPIVPTRRARQTPPAATPVGEQATSVEAFLDKDTPMIQKLRMLKGAGIFSS